MIRFDTAGVSWAADNGDLETPLGAPSKINKTRHESTTSLSIYGPKPDTSRMSIAHLPMLNLKPGVGQTLVAWVCSGLPLQLGGASDIQCVNVQQLRL